MQNDHLFLNLARCLAVFLAISYGVGVSQAQTNGARVGVAVDPALQQICAPSEGSLPICSVSTVQASQLAPDKLVMQSVRALATVSQQFSVVGGRLDELRGAGSGSTTQRSSKSSASSTPQTGATQRAPFSADEASKQERDAGGAGSPSTKAGMYFHVEGDKGDVDPTTFDPGFMSHSEGFTIGADYKLSDQLLFGGALSYTSDRSVLDTSDGTPSGNMKTHSANVSLYGAYYPSATSYFDATLIYGRNRYRSVRDLSLPGVIDSAIGSTDGSQYGLNVSAGHSFLVENFSFGPYAQLSILKATVDAFTEQANVSQTQLAVQEQSANSLVSTVGGQVSYAVSTSWGVLVPNARFEWAHQYEDDRSGSIVARFAAAEGNAPPINIETSRPDRNYFNLGLGLASHFGVGQSAFVYYQTVLGKDGTTNHALTVELRLEF